jgi:hypothetical protein
MDTYSCLLKIISPIEDYNCLYCVCNNDYLHFEKLQNLSFTNSLHVGDSGNNDRYFLFVWQMTFCDPNAFRDYQLQLQKYGFIQ